MSFTKPVSSTKTEKTSVLYRHYIFMFALVFLLTGILTVQVVSATGFNFQKVPVQQLGHTYMQQAVLFSQAQTAFESKNYAYSVSILKPLALNGHTEAQYLLAVHYDLGLGVKRSAPDSFYWYKKAASAGINIAQHNLAVAYAEGNGIDADLVKAVRWWERAANAGNTDSQYNLGIIYAAGRDSIKADMKKALKWWRMAAMRGDAAAQFNLGVLYANGIGMSSRTCEASRWWKKSAANGFAQAEMALAVLETKSDYASCP
ncbi:MAG: sel1 repeat family protein [Gammaproteobacteria bacterium]|nr:sel1 repeat family protein [Gammaproteobacteria bacterium]